MTSYSKKELEKFLAVATECAMRGGEILQKYWGKIASINQKTHQGDLVTEADQESEALVIGILKENFPLHGILAEESGLNDHRNDTTFWSIDPLDGTTNYTHQYPMVAVSIGLVHHGEPIVGVVYNPILKELYTGVKGWGSFLNDRSISVSKTATLEESLLVTGFAYDRRVTEDNNFFEMRHLGLISQGIRRSGSAALDMCYLAAGRVDAYWEQGLSSWDLAAGTIIVREAGGKVTDYLGENLLFSTQVIKKKQVISSNGVVHPILEREIHKVRREFGFV